MECCGLGMDLRMLDSNVATMTLGHLKRFHPGMGEFVVPWKGSVRGDKADQIARNFLDRSGSDFFSSSSTLGLMNGVFVPVFGHISGRNHSNFLCTSRNQQELRINVASETRCSDSFL
jgi:hypothetical protein